MTPNQNPTNAVIEELAPQIAECTTEEAYTFLSTLFYFGVTYSEGCQLDGDVFVVLDNSVIQSLKHRESKRKRWVNALAYIAFCRFARNFCSREATFAVTPAAVFENMGRRCSGSTAEAKRALKDIEQTLHITHAPIIGIGFDSAKRLAERLSDVEADEAYLSALIEEIDGRSWSTDLRADIGVKIPFRVAAEALPSPMPLRYFDEFYVSFVLSGRIEKKIIAESKGNPQAPPIGSGELADYFSDLNERNRRSGKFSGFGDIDIFQVCDLSRQFQDGCGRVYIGHTNDRLLSKILLRRTSFVLGTEVVIGSAEQEDQVRKSLELIMSDPFREYSQRGETAAIPDQSSGPSRSTT